MQSVQANRSRAAIYAHFAFFTCICLQRFGLHVGHSELSISIPVLFGLTIWMLLNGEGRLSREVSLLFLAFAAWASVTAWAATLWPDLRMGYSIMSFLNLLSVYATLTLRPGPSFDGKEVQRVFLFYARLVAALGIIQFSLQFVGIRLFAFSIMFPALKPILLEGDFAFDPLLSFGSDIRRSNGFLLVEPSHFSQILAIAIVLDFFILGRRKYLPLYVVAYMTSFSGTGLLALCGALVYYTSGMGKHFTRVMMLGGVAVLVGLMFAIILPEQFGVFLKRFNEIGYSGSSGNQRFVQPIYVIGNIIGETRSLLGYGPGATTRAPFFDEGNANSIMQVFIDYGMTGAILFYIFQMRALWNKQYAGLSIMLLITFQVGGGYLLFTPFTLLLVSLGIFATGRLPHKAAESHLLAGSSQVRRSLA